MSQNKWIMHVKEYAKNNNMSYACAISDPKCKASYIPVIKLTKKQKEVEQNKKFQEDLPGLFLERLINIDKKPTSMKLLLQHRFNNYSKEVQDKIIELDTNDLLNKLFQ
jgi:hypothetical protein